MTEASRSATQPSFSVQGIQPGGTVFANLSFDELREHELRPDQPGHHQGHDTDTGAVVVYTGRFTGRSSKDKYLVEDDLTRDSVWWKSDTNGSDNQPMDAAAWDAVKGVTFDELSRGDLYVMDLFCGTNPETRMAVRVVTTVAWGAHFAKNMFVRPTAAELAQFEPDWTVFHAPEAELATHADYGMRSPVFAAFNLSERSTCVGGTWYGGEIKKGLFSMMNYFLPMQGVGSFHCSANVGERGDSALFFGLSGTGKTTLSTDPKRELIGDDEHGWDNQGVFNFEGGCYAKTIDLSADSEPEIFAAIRRNALLENVPLKGASPDYSDRSLTENTRVSYPPQCVERQRRVRRRPEQTRWHVREELQQVHRQRRRCCPGQSWPATRLSTRGAAEQGVVRPMGQAHDLFTVTSRCDAWGAVAGFPQPF